MQRLINGNGDGDGSGYGDGDGSGYGDGDGSGYGNVELRAFHDALEYLRGVTPAKDRAGGSNAAAECERVMRGCISLPDTADWAAGRPLAADDQGTLRYRKG